MTMRALIDSIILSDEVLTSHIPASRWGEAGSFNETPKRPFAEYRWSVTNPGPHTRSQVASANLSVYVHDDPGNNSEHIIPVLARLRRTLEEAVTAVGFDASLVGADWQFDGPDAYDDGHRTAVRYGTYRIVGTGL